MLCLPHAGQPVSGIIQLSEPAVICIADDVMVIPLSHVLELFGEGPLENTTKPLSRLEYPLMAQNLNGKLFVLLHDVVRVMH